MSDSEISCGDNREHRIFTVPVGNLSSEDIEEYIKKIKSEYKEYEYGDYWFPVKDDKD